MFQTKMLLGAVLFFWMGGQYFQQKERIASGTMQFQKGNIKIGQGKLGEGLYVLGSKGTSFFGIDGSGAPTLKMKGKTFGIEMRTTQEGVSLQLTSKNQKKGKGSLPRIKLSLDSQFSLLSMCDESGWESFRLGFKGKSEFGIVARPNSRKGKMMGFGVDCNADESTGEIRLTDGLGGFQFQKGKNETSLEGGVNGNTFRLSANKEDIKIETWRNGLRGTAILDQKKEGKGFASFLLNSKVRAYLEAGVSGKGEPRIRFYKNGKIIKTIKGK